MPKHEKLTLPINWIALRNARAGCSQSSWQSFCAHPHQQRLRSKFSKWLLANSYLRSGDNFLGVGSKHDDDLPFGQKQQLHLVDGYSINQKNCLVASPYDLPLADGFCDVSLIFFVLHYSNHPQVMLQELARVTGDGGYLVLVNYQRWTKFRVGEQLQRSYVSSFLLNKWLHQCSLNLHQSKNFWGIQIRVYRKRVLNPQKINYKFYKSLPLAWVANYE